MSEDEMAGWHHQCNGHELGQTLGDGEGQGGLACCSPHGLAESRTRLGDRTTTNDSQLTAAMQKWTYPTLLAFQVKREIQISILILKVHPNLEC